MQLRRAFQPFRLKALGRAPAVAQSCVHHNLDNVMNRFTTLTAAATPALAATGASAQGGTQSVEVRPAAAPRTDIDRLCPDVGNELPDTLATVARKLAVPATIDVRFALDGSRVSDVETSAGPRAYRAAIRWAVAGLQCSSPDTGPQPVAVRVRFVDPATQPGDRPVALLGTFAPR
jgi:hypothetical protein